MKAAVLRSAKGQFHILDVHRPSPTFGEVLVRIKASGVNPLDAEIRAGNAPHALHDLPAILGLEMAGIGFSMRRKTSSIPRVRFA